MNDEVVRRAADALFILRAQIAAARANGQRVDSVPLASYESPADYAELCGGTLRDWTIAQRTTRLVAEEIAAMGLKAILVPMSAPAVAMWLRATGRKNTPESRALYASGFVAPN